MPAEGGRPPQQYGTMFYLDKELVEKAWQGVAPRYCLGNDSIIFKMTDTNCHRLRLLQP